MLFRLSCCGRDELLKRNYGLKVAGGATTLLLMLMLISACDILGPFTPYSNPPPTPTPVVVCTANSRAASPALNYPPLNSVSMISPTEGWAAGNTDIATGDVSLVHYLNGKWLPLHGSAAIDDYIYDVQMLSADDGLAGGQKGITRYQGDCWHLERAVPGYITRGVNSVYSLSSDEAWAAGYDFLYYHNQHWDNLYAANKVMSGGWVNSVQMLSPTDGWAVGYDGSIAHYTGGQWTEVGSPTTVELHAIQMTSPSNGWAVGPGSFILHYSNGAWTIQNSPAVGVLYGISMLSANEGWVVGSKQDGDKNQDLAVVLHYKDGQWNEEPVNIPGALHGVQMLSANEGWAVGANQDGKTGLILHYQNGTWSEYKLTCLSTLSPLYKM